MQCLYLITQHQSWTPEHMLYQLVLKMVVLLTLPITVRFSQSFTFDWLCKFLCWPSHFSSHPFPTHTYPSSILVINLLYICFIHRPIQKWEFLSLSLAKDDIILITPSQVSRTARPQWKAFTANRPILGEFVRRGPDFERYGWVWSLGPLMEKIDLTFYQFSCLLHWVGRLQSLYSSFSLLALTW